MKNFAIIFFLLFFTGISAQNKGLDIRFSYGTTMPTGTYGHFTVPDDSVGFPGGHQYLGYGYTLTRTGAGQYNLDLVYKLGKWAWGIGAGHFTHKVSTFSYPVDFSYQHSGGTITGNYLGFGPEYRYGGKKLGISLVFRAGRMQLKTEAFRVDYTGDDAAQPVMLFTGKSVKPNTGAWFSSAGIRMDYALGKALGLFAKFDYMGTLGSGIKVKETYYRPFDVDANGKIDMFDVHHFTIEEFRKENIREVKPSMYNIGLGLIYHFPVRNAHSPVHPVKNTPAPVKVEDSKKDDMRRIILVSPPDQSRFKNPREAGLFRWRVEGKKFKNPVYIVTAAPVGKQGRVYTALTSKTSVRAVELFRGNEVSGIYRWHVTEQHSGEQSGDNTITFSDCQFDMHIDSLQIECLGYEGEQRKYKICFDLNYSSATGDLTFNNTGSGLTVYDQSYNSLSVTLLAPNTSLQTQAGSSGSTVQYCFETLVDASVTSIGVAVQGDDLDPSPVTCQPGVAANIDELPDCLCDECDSLEITAEGFHTVNNGGSPYQVEVDGNIQVNAPVYGMEMQIVSWNYTSTPGSCSEGVSNVESSGVFLGGTSINGSTNIQFYNETSSPPGSGTNNNASKDIKYVVNSPMSGSIPVHLNLGLPGPISGLNADCCTMEYNVCILIKVYYEDGTCKTCRITKCFSFNNQ